MKIFLAPLVFLSVISTLPTLSYGSGNYVPGEVVVKFKKQTPAHTRDQILYQHSGILWKDLDGEGLAHVKLLGNFSVDQLRPLLERVPRWSMPNRIIFIKPTKLSPPILFFQTSGP